MSSRGIFILAITWIVMSPDVYKRQSYDCLKKMANDPEFAKEIEWNLSGEVAANSQVYSFEMCIRDSFWGHNNRCANGTCCKPSNVPMRNEKVL